jgi:hypothetical protein
MGVASSCNALDAAARPENVWPVAVDVKLYVTKGFARIMSRNADKCQDTAAAHCPKKPSRPAAARYLHQPECGNLDGERLTVGPHEHFQNVKIKADFILW